MDVVPPCRRYDPMADEEEDAAAAAMLFPSASPASSSGSSNHVTEGPVAAAHRKGEMWALWYQAAGKDAMGSGERSVAAPSWFRDLCYDLFFRLDRTAEPQQPSSSTSSSSATASPLSEPAPSSEGAGSELLQKSGEGEGVDDDPYAFLPFQLLSEEEYIIQPFTFPAARSHSPPRDESFSAAWFLNEKPEQEFVCFALGYPFPERHQLPTSIGTCPTRLYVNPTHPTPVVFIQLDPAHPPAAWLPVKPTAAAVRRVLSSFAAQAVQHRDHHHERWASREKDAREVLRLQGMPHSEDGDVLRMVGYHARHVLYHESLAVQDGYQNEQNFFLGEFDDPETELLQRVDLCGDVFATSEMRTVVDPHAEHSVPTIDGPGVAISLYRTRFSKAYIQVSVQLSAEVKLPPLDQEAFEFMWKDSQVMPRMKIPVFARVMWPGGSSSRSDREEQLEQHAQRMAGGGVVARRFNARLGTEFAEDMPVDAMMALLSIQWARIRGEDGLASSSSNKVCCLGPLAMRQRVQSLMQAIEHGSSQPPPLLLYPSTAEVPNPEYTLPERLGMWIQAWAHVDDPAVVCDAIRRTIFTNPILPSAPVRMGCAKAALIAGDRELFRWIVSREPPGRMQTYMTKIVRKRKSRDLLDDQHRVLDSQYEYAAPLWTARHTRIDPNTVEGQMDMKRRLSHP